MKKMNKKGFTLAELLVVLAIMAILIAIAIPVFSAQLEKARVAVDEGNARSAKSLATAQWLLDGVSGSKDYYFTQTDSDIQLAAAGATSSTVKAISNTYVKDSELKVTVDENGVATAYYGATKCPKP